MLAEERLFYPVYSLVSVGSRQSSATPCQNFVLLYHPVQDQPGAKCHVLQVGHSGDSGPACHQSRVLSCLAIQSKRDAFSWDDPIEPAWWRRLSWRALLPFCFI